MRNSRTWSCAYSLQTQGCLLWSLILHLNLEPFQVYIIPCIRNSCSLFSRNFIAGWMRRWIKGAAHLWGFFFHHFFSFRNFYFPISSFLHYVVWLLKYKRKFFWKILVTPRWVMAGRMVNKFFLVGTISHVWMIGNSKSIFILKEGMNGYRP